MYTATIFYPDDKGQAREVGRGAEIQGAVDTALSASAVNARRRLIVEDDNGTVILMANLRAGLPHAVITDATLAAWREMMDHAGVGYHMAHGRKIVHRVRWWVWWNGNGYPELHISMPRRASKEKN